MDFDANLILNIAMGVLLASFIKGAAMAFMGSLFGLGGTQYARKESSETVYNSLGAKSSATSP